MNFDGASTTTPRAKRRRRPWSLAAEYPARVLRPTLMFGWFDRKHLGWLARFMRAGAGLPGAGHGRYIRQPLYVGDFCEIIIACLERRVAGETYNISGLERITYIDLIRRSGTLVGSRRADRPHPLWRVLGSLASTPCSTAIRRSRPGSSRPCHARVFEVIDWPAIFGVQRDAVRR